MYKLEKIQKIIQTKSKRALFLREICYNIDMKNIAIKQLQQLLDINYRTAKKLKEQYNMKDLLHQIKIDRALRQLVFSCPEQIECFYFLTKDLNYFLKFNDVQTKIKISRYNYNKVKDYIQEELQKITIDQ